MKKSYYACYFDGACEPRNPGGNMGIGAFILNPEREVIFTHSRYVKSSDLNGKTTNNIAEYMALIAILEFLLGANLQDQEIKCVGDSKLVVEQMNGNRGVNGGDYVPYHNQAYDMMVDFSNISFHWIPREQNSIADELSKKCMVDNGCEFRIQKR